MEDRTEKGGRYAQTYLHLFHGRKDINEQMDDWGEDGPTFGLLRWVHTTYAGELKLGMPCSGDDCVVLTVVDDCVYYDGMYYGDWSVYAGHPDPAAREITLPVQAKADPPKIEPAGEVCPECGNTGFLLNASFFGDDTEITRCEECDRYDTDAEAVEAAFKLACRALDRPAAEPPNPVVAIEVDDGLIKEVLVDRATDIHILNWSADGAFDYLEKFKQRLIDTHALLHASSWFFNAYDETTDFTDCNEED